MCYLQEAHNGKTRKKQKENVKKEGIQPASQPAFFTFTISSKQVN